MLIECAALESAFHGVRVNGVAPGFTISKTRTKADSLRLTEGENNKYLSEAARDVPLNNQLTTPKDISNAMLFLASDDASFITGEIMVIDGG